MERYEAREKHPRPLRLDIFHIIFLGVRESTIFHNCAHSLPSLAESFGPTEEDLKQAARPRPKSQNQGIRALSKGQGLHTLADKPERYLIERVSSQ